jgi:hypothetical protein
MMATVDVTPDSGRYSKNLNRPTETSLATASPSAPAARPVSMKMAVLPNTVIQKKVNPAGINSTAPLSDL